MTRKRGNFDNFPSPKSCLKKSQTHYNCHSFLPLHFLFALLLRHHLKQQNSLGRRHFPEICRSRWASLQNGSWSVGACDKVLCSPIKMSHCAILNFCVMKMIVKNCIYSTVRTSTQLESSTQMKLLSFTNTKQKYVKKKKLKAYENAEIGSNDKKLLVITYEMKVFLLLQASPLYDHPFSSPLFNLRFHADTKSRACGKLLLFLAHFNSDSELRDFPLLVVI